MKRRTYFATIIAISFFIYICYEIRQPDVIAYISLDASFSFNSEKGWISYIPPTVIGKLSEGLHGAIMSFSPVLNKETILDILQRMNEAYTSDSSFLFYRYIPKKNAPYMSFFIFLFSRKDVGKMLQVGFNGFSFSFEENGKEKVCVVEPREYIKITSRITVVSCAGGDITTLTYASPSEVLSLLDKGNIMSDFHNLHDLPQLEEFKLGHVLSRTIIDVR